MSKTRYPRARPLSSAVWGGNLHGFRMILVALWITCCLLGCGATPSKPAVIPYPAALQPQSCVAVNVEVPRSLDYSVERHRYVTGYAHHISISDRSGRGAPTQSCYSLPVEGLMLSAHGDNLFVQMQDLSIRVYDLTSLQETNSTGQVVTRIRAIAALGDSVLLGGADGIIYRWWWRGPERFDREGASKQLERYIGHSSAIEALVWHPDGSTFFSGDAAGIVNAWQVFEQDLFAGTLDKSASTGALFTSKAARVALAREPLNAAVAQLALSSDHLTLAVTTADGFVELWRVQGLELMDRKELPQFGLPRSVVFGGSGAWIELLDRSGRSARLPISQGLDRWGMRQRLILGAPDFKQSSAQMLVGNDSAGLIAGVTANGQIIEWK